MSEESKVNLVRSNATAGSWLVSFWHRLISPSPVLTPDADQSPSWAKELLESMQKLSRSNARVSLRLEDLEKKVEGGFAEARARTAAVPKATASHEILDVLDALDEACRVIAITQPEIAQGLDRLSRRVEQLSLQHTYIRLRPEGTAPDGRLFKVVGTTPCAEIPEGMIARVIRAAVTTRDGMLFREGEVLTSRKDV